MCTSYRENTVKMTRIAAIALPAAALLAAGLPIAANAAASHKTTTKTTVAVYNCVNKPQVRPGVFYVFCDGSGYYSNLKWTTWSTTMATATGVEYVNNCEPNCASGKFSHQNVDLILWKSAPVAHHQGQYGFTKMTTLYPNTGKTYTQTPPGVFPGEF
jgi:hypothetical protein